MNLLLTLAVGLALIILAFLGLNRGLRLPGRQAAVILAILTLGFYLPYALLHWEGADVLAINDAVEHGFRNQMHHGAVYGSLS